MELALWQTVSLSLLILVVLFLPLTVHKVEENLEAFLFCCGIFAVTVAKSWSGGLILTALEDPIKITLAVFFAGLLFKYCNKHLQKAAKKAVGFLGLRTTLFLIVFLLGMFSSFITAIIAALILSEVVMMLPLNREGRTRTVVFACYSIGMGAVLTAIGEPLGTVVLSKLAGEPHNADFWFLIEHLGWYILGGVMFVSLLASAIRADTIKNAPGVRKTPPRRTSTASKALPYARAKYICL